VIFGPHSAPGFTNPGLSPPGNAAYLLLLSLRVFSYDTREKRVWQYADSCGWIFGATLQYNETVNLLARMVSEDCQ